MCSSDLGTIDARPVFVTGDDFTVRGGANDGGVKDKFTFAETWAARWRVPLVRLVDGTGGGGSVKHLETMGRTYLPDVEAFTEVLDAMSEEKRAVFVLFELERMSCGEIAELMGVPVGTVHSRLHTARAEVRAAFEGSTEVAP